MHRTALSPRTTMQRTPRRRLRAAARHAPAAASPQLKAALGALLEYPEDRFAVDDVERDDPGD